MSWKEIFVSQERRFLQYLIEQSEMTLAGVALLCEIMEHPMDGERRGDLIESIGKLEKRGDEIRRSIIGELRDTFVTPLDREDIYALSKSVDDILDYADSTVKVLIAYNVEPTPEMVQMVDALREGASFICGAIGHIMTDVEQSMTHMIAAKKLENRMEELYRRANAELFDQTDIHFIFKVREVYRHLSNAADRVDEAADIVGSILIKGNV